MIIFREVSAYYGKKKVLEDISFELHKAAIVVVIGPNGSGKTTLLKTFLNLVPFVGYINFLGYDPKKHQREIRKMVGYMPQRDTISEDIPLRVRDILLMTLYSHIPLFKSSKEKLIEKCQSTLRSLNLHGLWNKSFNKLSGGQKQRVLFARAIITEPRVLLLDEPFNGVDIPSQYEIIRVLIDLRNRGITSFIVAHDLETLAPCADYILIINRKMYGFGKPLEVLRQDILEKVYGKKVPILMHEGICYPIIGDRHG